VCAIVGQYGSEVKSLSSHRSAAATSCSRLDEVPTAMTGRGCGSCSYEDGSGAGLAVSGATSVHGSMTAPDPWCPSRHSVMAGKKLVDVWTSSDDSEDLAELFSRIGLGKYTDIFQQQEVVSDLQLCSCRIGWRAICLC